MARIVVVGGGFGGLASAARLAKLGHEVTLTEARDRVGGVLGTVEQDGFAWDLGPTHTLLPAVIRDLFRKSGRPVERELDLVHLAPAAQHRFPDRKKGETRVDLPAGSRGDQHAALTEAFGEAVADQWIAYVDGFDDVWAALRKDWLERPWSPAQASDLTRDLVSSRLTLHKHTEKQLKDPRLQRLARHRFALDGHNPRDVPWWQGMWHYVEQTFGTWTIPGGMGALAGAMAERLETRKVTVLTGVKVRDLALEGGRAVGVLTDSGPIDADVVVVAVDPRSLPALASYVVRTMPAIPPIACHVGIVGDVPDLPDDLPHEIVVHDEASIVVRTNGQAPDGARAWTLLGRGNLSEDIVTATHRAGFRILDLVETRVDMSPRDTVEMFGSSPQGVLWQGRRTFDRMLGPDTPLPGVHLAGAHAAPGGGLPQVGLSAALVAQRVGPA